MSKITNDGLTLTGTGCFTAVTHMATVGVKGLRQHVADRNPSTDPLASPLRRLRC